MHKENFAVVGLGKQGTLIAETLLKLGHEVVGYDNNEEAVKNRSFKCVCLNNPKQIVENADDLGTNWLISTAPYTLNLDLFQQCLNCGINYADLGGHIDTSQEIRKRMLDGADYINTLTDIGLAPGLVNIIACDLIRQGHKVIELYCGGLPNNAKGPLGYSICFNVEGLINEYINSCEHIINGKVKTVEPMGNYLTFGTLTDHFESFNTSGVTNLTIPFALENNVEHFSYQTIRYEGHRALAKFLIMDIGISYDEIINILKRLCPPDSNDRVIIMLLYGKSNRLENYLKLDIRNQDGYTAMQRATALPAVAAIMSAIENKTRGYIAFENINVNTFKQYLNQLMPGEIAW